MTRHSIPLLAFALVLASCTSDSGTESTTSSTPEPTAERGSVDPGRLVVLDGTGNIVVMDPDGANQQAVTDDTGDDRALYMQPIWSPDGTTLAWGQASDAGFGVAISRPGSGDITALGTPNLPFYTSWSPNGRHIGILHNGTTGVQFQIVDVKEETLSPLDEDAPFYFSWSPEGDRVVTHAGANRVETIRPDGERDELERTAETYLAPQWTSNGIFHVVDDQVVVEDEAGQRSPVVVVSGVTMFVANKQGTMVGLQSTGGGPGPITASTEDPPSVASNAVAIVEVSSGRVITPSDQPAIGFFWSPGGDMLLILTLDEESIVPLVWTEEETTRYPGFSPAPPMIRDTFPFFPQYAQSVSFWSPDSSAFAFAGAVGEEAGIWVQELDADAPQHVSDGTWVAWTPRS